MITIKACARSFLAVQKCDILQQTISLRITKHNHIYPTFSLCLFHLPWQIQYGQMKTNMKCHHQHLAMKYKAPVNVLFIVTRPHFHFSNKISASINRGYLDKFSRQNRKKKKNRKKKFLEKIYLIGITMNVIQTIRYETL